MPTAYNYLEITDGDLAAVFMNAGGTSTNYTLVWDTWAPSIAVPRAGELGLPYMSTNEEWRFNIIGSTPALCLQYLQTINALFERAWRWWRKRERVNTTNSPVLIKYQLKGSTLSVPLQDVVIIDTDRAPILLPTDFTAVGDFYRITGLKVNFTRKNGLWLGESEFDSVSATAAPGPMTITYTETAKHLDPIDAILTATATGGVSGTSASGIIAFANEAAYLAVIEGASSGTGASLIFTGTTSTVDTTNLSTNGRVGRLTATTSEGSIISSGTLGGTDTEYIALYLAVKNGSTTVDCILRGEIVTTGGRAIAAPEITLRAVSPANPQVVFVGLWKIDPNDIVASVRVYYRSTSGSITIDIDYGAAIWIGKATSIITLSGINPDLDIRLDHALLTEQQAVVRRNDAPLQRLNHTGNPYVFYGGHYVYFSALVMLVQSNFWVVANNAGTSAAQWILDATRTKGYLTPE